MQSRAKGQRGITFDLVTEIFPLSVRTVEWPVGALELPTYQAHRGFRPTPDVQENTIEAFRRAREAGAVMSECDVHLSRDGEAVVFHDIDLMRIAGRKEQVADLSAAQMKELAGAPTLLELLNDSESPQLVNIELKTADVFVSRGLEAAVVKAVGEAGAEKRVIFSSFNPFAVRRLSVLAPRIPRALIASERPHRRNHRYLKKMWLGTWCRPHLLHLDEQMLTLERLTKFNEQGTKVIAWTVNDPGRADELLRHGARGIISDVIFSSQRG